ncbi:MAG TPA: CDP-diacylglycerol--glycerol-3-phosphate 3-phosphatidyltransferase [Clostridiaceae bacterium]|jgi:CDP-diacylglycerol--glycerol-3-phosphate 3-phosphatidyltransferase|nr:CDP-diacylglycerol--glycerol-3-phosphate 3-phosphatidyltransferase [Clostridiaceae bacterium]HBG38953.1 CDP-diacylglycerol--glycerol-3-phosphate 3-phosphatidyltransferase [Clostridiaceae bacterium]HBN29476.1 CDP-diacylglycerol--glycerol-3-phosphate 3-phosphatidyltransferase [Clostridiaceae bacterium]
MNTANKLTILRMILVPVFLVLISISSEGYNYTYAATAVFAVAAFTDFLDGYIARKKNQVTKFGKFMDPLADKLIVISAMVALVEMDKLQAWVVMIVIARELAVTGLRTLAASDGIVIAASYFGKAKTVTQIIAIIAMLLDMPYGIVIMGIAVVITVLSGIDYFYKNRNVLKIQD